MKAAATLRSLDRASVVLLWLGATALVFSLWLFHGWRFNVYPPAKAERVAYGGAERPFVTRVLVPWTARATLAPLPETTRRELVDRWAADRPWIDRYLAFFSTPRSFALELALIVLLDAAALLGFALALRRLFRSLYAASAWVERIAPVAAVLLLPVLFARFNHYFYDFPALALFTAAVLLLRQRRHGALLVVLAVGALNKETIAFALGVSLLEELRGGRREGWIRRLSVQTLVVAAARAVAIGFAAPAAETGAGLLPNYFVVNLLAFARDPFLLDLGRVASLLVFALLVFAGWSRKPPFLRAAFPVVVPVLALYLWGSYWGEIRTMLELFPLAFLLGYQTIAEAIGLDLRVRPEPPPPPEPFEPPAPAFVPIATSLVLGVFLLGSALSLAALAQP